jgi:hypothetical protein
MSTKQVDREIAELFQQADNYARLASEKFLLETVIPEPVPEWADDVDKAGYAIQSACAKYPGFVINTSFSTWQIHFLFPNLSEKERGLLVALHSSSEFLLLSVNNKEEPSDSDRARFAKRLKEIEEIGLEKKLTEIQVRILASDFFDYTSDTAHEE